jgi:hypothetical protein
MARVLFMAGSSDFTFLRHIHMCSGAQPALYYIIGTGVLSSEIKLLGHKVDQRLSISNFIKNHPAAVFISKHLEVRHTHMVSAYCIHFCRSCKERILASKLYILTPSPLMFCMVYL